MEVFRFHAKWCQGCVAMTPIFNGIKVKYPNVKFKDIDVDTEEGAKMSCIYNVKNVPVVMIVNNGKEIDRISGNRNAQEITSLINKHIK